jgi:release factor glutamine methyltransferase
MRRNMIRDDSWHLIDAVTKVAVSAGRHVLDLCTGSGVVGAAAASRVRPASPRWTSVPTLCSAPAPLSRGGRGPSPGRVTPRVERRAVDVVVCNPPYMPVGRHAGIEVIPTAAGPAAAMTGVRFWIRCATGRWSCCGRWHHVGGPVRIVRGWAVPGIVAVRRLDAGVVARQWIPFGPALSARTQWLERTAGCAVAVARSK